MLDMFCCIHERAQIVSTQSDRLGGRDSDITSYVAFDVATKSKFYTILIFNMPENIPRSNHCRSHVDTRSTAHYHL